MPLSRPDTIPRIINLIWETNPQSILDCGCGFGGMGVLFRQTTDIRWGRYEHWETIIHGIEIQERYRNPIWQYVYNMVRIGDALLELPQMPQDYDLVFLGDVLEHLEKDRALKLLNECINKAKKYVVITTPIEFHDNIAEAQRFGNPHEEHKCVLEDTDFPEGSVIEQYGSQKIIIITK